MKNFAEYISNLKKRKFNVAIIGLGYVGLPLAKRFLDENFKVYGIDVDSSKIDDLLKGRQYIKNISIDSIKSKINKNFIVSTKFENIKDADAIIITVPTPLDSKKDPDLSFIKSALLSIKPFLKKGQLLSLESTTYPGTTRELIFPILNEINLKVGNDFFVTFSPEREDPGNKNFHTKNTPKLVGGVTKKCGDVGELLYQQIIDEVVRVSSADVAEFAKILENVYRCVNISLINELKVLADKMNLDMHEIVDAAGTKPFGFQKFYPGPGLGGHCIPIDPFYLSYAAKRLNYQTKFVELAGEINDSMPELVINKANVALNYSKKSINGSKILLLGAAYKKNIDDPRESPFFKIYEKLNHLGAKLFYQDSFIPNVKVMSKTIKAISEKKIKYGEYDLVILITDHDDFDYKNILNQSKLIIDCRGRFPFKNKKVYRA